MYANQGSNRPMVGCVERNFEKEVEECRERIAAASGVIPSMDALNSVMSDQNYDRGRQDPYTLVYGDMHMLLKYNKDRVDATVKAQAVFLKKQEVQLKKTLAALAKTGKKVDKPSTKKVPAEKTGDKEGKSIV